MIKKLVIEFSVNNISNELENLIFIHPLSLYIWQEFPHVLIIDAAYKTNKYVMYALYIWQAFPHVLIIDATYKTNKYIVGVTSTKKAFIIAFAFIINKKEKSYK
uniref:MULE transposase domain-containing protein n=1 Tax=Lactuca sativa TaxID=4236 RepID=A0A9R1UFX5_LACSA|nr:hypothetical protein LSAT_V11C900494380 [Lactuca sativa]